MQTTRTAQAWKDQYGTWTVGIFDATRGGGASSYSTYPSETAAKKAAEKFNAAEKKSTAKP